MMKRRTVLKGISAAGLTAGSGLRAHAQASPKITVAYTATTDFGPGFIAMEQGLFKKRGLDVEFKLVPVNPQIPAALQSESMQVGGTTTTVFLQAVDGGVDLVALSGSGITDNTMKLFGTVMRTEVAYAKPEDYIGKKVGAPGFGAFLHVLFRNWLIEKGIDPKKVTFVEVGFPQMPDVLKGGTVDAVITGEPFTSRIEQAGIGRATTYFAEVLKTELPIIVYSATRKWVQANPAAAKAFQEAISEATDIANKDHEAVRAATPRFIQLPPAVIAATKFGRWSAPVTEAGLASWFDIMKRQDMLRSDVDLKKLIVR